MKRVGIGALALGLSSAALAQASQAPTSPPNGSTPTGSTRLGAPGDSGSGMGTMDAGNQSMASDPSTTDKGMTKPHSKHRGAKADSSASGTATGTSSPH